MNGFIYAYPSSKVRSEIHRNSDATIVGANIYEHMSRNKVLH